MTRPARVKGLHHLTLVTRDMDEVVRFFNEVLGILLVKIDHNFDRPEQKHYFFGDAKGQPGTLVTFFEISDLPGNTLGPGGMHHVAFWVQDEDALRAQIKHLDGMGIGHSEIIDRIYFKSLYFRGPEDLLIEFATEGPGFPEEESP
jgi:glyoxalase family protein